MRKDKPWFGPMRSIWKAAVPVSWEGYTVTVAFLLGMILLGLESDPTRRSLAIALLVVAYFAVVCLTWEDPEAGGGLNWRAALFNWRTLAWVAFLVVLGGAIIAAGYQSCAMRRNCAGSAAFQFRSTAERLTRSSQ